MVSRNLKSAETDECQWRSQDLQLGGAQKWARLRAREIFVNHAHFGQNLCVLERSSHVVEHSGVTDTVNQPIRSVRVRNEKIDCHRFSGMATQCVELLGTDIVGYTEKRQVFPFCRKKLNTKN